MPEYLKYPDIMSDNKTVIFTGRYRMRNNPSLREILDEKCSGEWIDLPISSVSFRDWADSENEKGEILFPIFNFSSENVTSEYGTHTFDNVVIEISKTSKKKIQGLKGRAPLGAISFGDERDLLISLCLTKKTIDKIFSIAVHDLENLMFRVSIPDWKDKEVKWLPVMHYQFLYQNEI